MAATYTNLARRLGREHGAAAASWVTFDSPEHAREWLRAWSTGDMLRAPFSRGDPFDHIPGSPLSGEWADGMTPGQLLVEIGAHDDHDSGDYNGPPDAYCDAYENAYSAAATATVERIARMAARP